MEAILVLSCDENKQNKNVLSDWQKVKYEVVISKNILKELTVIS